MITSGAELAVIEVGSLKIEGFEAQEALSFMNVFN